MNYSMMTDRSVKSWQQEMQWMLREIMHGVPTLPELYANEQRSADEVNAMDGGPDEKEETDQKDNITDKLRRRGRQASSAAQKEISS